MRYAALFALIIALLTAPQTALACTPPPGGLPNYTTADRTNAAQVVVEGAVVSVQADPTTYRDTAVIQVTSYLKGIGPEFIAVSGYGQSSVCLSPVSQGQVAIFFVNGDATRGFTASYLSQFDAVLLMQDSTLQEVLVASGQAARTDFTPYAMSTPDAIFTQSAATQLPPSVPFPTPTPYFGPPASAPNTELIFLGVGGGVGFVCGGLVGLMLGLGLAVLRRRKD